MKKSYTILISSNDKNSSYKELRLSPRYLRFLVIGCSLVATFLLVFVIDYVNSFSHQMRSQKHQSENQILKTRLHQAKVQMDQLHSRLNQIEDFTRKIKIITGLENSPSSHLLAIGPLPHSSHSDMPSSFINTQTLPGTKTLPSLSVPTSNETSLIIYIDQLNKKSSLARENLTLVLEQLYKKRDILNSTPSIMPTRGWVSSDFGYRTYPFTGEVALHEGIDIAALPGTPVYAPSYGVVIFAGYQTGYGKVIIIDHGYQLSTLYGHLSDIMVSPWQEVKRGDVIGTVGNTGYSSGPHLHYEVRISNVPVDPNNYILDI